MNSILGVSNLECVGCRSCLQICPKKAISMIEDFEGFYYPDINNKCVECGVCIKHCPVLLTKRENSFQQEYYGLILKDKNKLLNSSSGGVFAGVALRFLCEGGVVFGCRFNDKLEAEHIGIDTIDALKSLQGSKYVASNTKKTYEEVRIALLGGKKVLYSGTPCQIAGLHAFLGADFETLYTIDLICHGTPSQKLFTRYLEWLGKHSGGKIVYYGFRDKDIGGWSCDGKFKTKTKIKKRNALCDPYYASFLRGETYRESCYSCKFANMDRVGDITIGDFWGIGKSFPNVCSEDGVSICIINTIKGKYIFEQIKNDFEYFSCKQSDFLEYNHNLIQPTSRPAIRDNIYKFVYKSNNFSLIAHKNYSIFRIKILIYSMIPTRLKQILKRIIIK